MTEDSITLPENKNQLISMAEAGEIYDFHPDYLRELARRERLKAQRVDRFWLTTRANVEEYIRSRRVTGFYRDDIQLDDD